MMNESERKELSGQFQRKVQEFNQLKQRLDATVNQRKRSQYSNWHHLSRLTRSIVDLQNVNWVIVATGTRIGGDKIRVLPCLRDCTVIDKRWTVLVEARFTLLVVLRDRVVGIALVDLHFGSFTLRDLADEVEQLIVCRGTLREQWDIVPR